MRREAGGGRQPAVGGWWCQMPLGVNRAGRTGPGQVFRSAHWRGGTSQIARQRAPACVHAPACVPPHAADSEGKRSANGIGCQGMRTGSPDEVSG